MRRNVTGTAASAVSPLTQNAHWNPPVNAAAVACPWPRSRRECVAATVEATATPIAPPICWDVLSSPDAIPIVICDTGESSDRHRDEREDGAAGHEQGAGEVRPELPVRWHLGRPQDPGTG